MNTITPTLTSVGGFGNQLDVNRAIDAKFIEPIERPYFLLSLNLTSNITVFNKVADIDFTLPLTVFIGGNGYDLTVMDETDLLSQLNYLDVGFWGFNDNGEMGYEGFQPVGGFQQDTVIIYEVQTVTDGTNVPTVADPIRELALRLSQVTLNVYNIQQIIDAGGNAQNFFNANLTANASHTHDAAGFNTTIGDMGDLTWEMDNGSFNAQNSFIALCGDETFTNEFADLELSSTRAVIYSQGLLGIDWSDFEAQSNGVAEILFTNSLSSQGQNNGTDFLQDDVNELFSFSSDNGLTTEFNNNLLFTISESFDQIKIDTFNQVNSIRNSSNNILGLDGKIIAQFNGDIIGNLFASIGDVNGDVNHTSFSVDDDNKITSNNTSSLFINGLLGNSSIDFEEDDSLVIDIALADFSEDIFVNFATDRFNIDVFTDDGDNTVSIDGSTVSGISLTHTQLTDGSGIGINAGLNTWIDNTVGGAIKFAVDIFQMQNQSSDPIFTINTDSEDVTFDIAGDLVMNTKVGYTGTVAGAAALSVINGIIVNP